MMSVLKQVTLGLAVAEAAYQFEHRDLHISNVLVKRTTKDIMEYRIDGRRYSVQTYGVRAYIIDLTFSRFDHSQ